MVRSARVVALAVLALTHVGCSGSGSTDSGAGSSLTAAECGALADQIGQETSTAGTCTVAVRLDYASLKILGHASYCGGLAPMDQQAAAAIASQALMGSFPANLISDAPSDSVWVFRTVAGDFGHATAISVTNGQTVFDGALDWSGVEGEGPGARGGSLPLQPSESHSDLGSGCAATAIEPLPMRSFELREGAAAPAARPDAALKVVLGTALPAGLQRWGSLRDAVVLTYAGREPDAINDWRSEYVVLLNAVASGT